MANGEWQADQFQRDIHASAARQFTKLLDGIAGGGTNRNCAETYRQLELARNLSHGIIRSVSLEADAVNDVLDRLEKFGDDVRVVILL